MSERNPHDLCSRCGKKRRQVAVLVPHKNGFICDECVVARNNIVLKLFDLPLKSAKLEENVAEDNAISDEDDDLDDIDFDEDLPDLPESEQNSPFDHDRLDKILYRNKDIQYIEKLGDEKIDPEAVSLVPKTIAELFCLIPLRREGNHLVVAFSDPGDEEAIKEVRNSSMLDVDVVSADAGDIEEAIQKFYPE